MSSSQPSVLHALLSGGSGKITGHNTYSDFATIITGWVVCKLLSCSRKISFACAFWKIVNVRFSFTDGGKDDGFQDQPSARRRYRGGM